MTYGAKHASVFFDSAAETEKRNHDKSASNCNKDVGSIEEHVGDIR